MLLKNFKSAETPTIAEFPYSQNSGILSNESKKKTVFLQQNKNPINIGRINTWMESLWQQIS